MHDDDDQVDLAVRRLAPDVEPMTDLSFAARRAQVLDTAASRTTAPRQRRPVRRWVAAAAAITAVTVGVLNFGGSGLAPPANAEAVSVLTNAADVTVQATDVPVGPGQYRYVKKKESRWGSVVLHGGLTADCWYRYERTEETWIPDDPNQDWLRRTTHTDPLETRSCTKDEILHSRFYYNEVTPWESRAKRGNFTRPDFVEPPGVRQGTTPPNSPGGLATLSTVPPGEPARPPEHPVNIFFPTPALLAQLPRDPRKLFTLLRDSTCLADACAFLAAEDMLGTGQIPGELRAAVYRALTRIPGMTVADRQANLDGRVGIAIRITDPGRVRDLIVDPKTGDYIGTRNTAMGSPGGALFESSSVRTGVADAIGAPPVR